MLSKPIMLGIIMLTVEILLLLCSGAPTSNSDMLTIYVQLALGHKTVSFARHRPEDNHMITSKHMIDIRMSRVGIARDLVSPSRCGLI